MHYCLHFVDDYKCIRYCCDTKIYDRWKWRREIEYVLLVDSPPFLAPHRFIFERSKDIPCFCYPSSSIFYAIWWGREWRLSDDDGEYNLRETFTGWVGVIHRQDNKATIGIGGRKSHRSNRN